MNVVCVDPRTDPIWHSLIESQQSSVFHSPEWLRVLTDTYNFDIQAYVLLDAVGVPCAGFPFYQITDGFSCRTICLPFSDYCDPIVNDDHQWRALIDNFLMIEIPVGIRCLHNDVPLLDERFTLIKRAKWHGVDLQPDLDVMWQSIDSSARRAINKARQNGVIIRAAEDQSDLRAFFEMHLGVRKNKYHLLAQPYNFFENIWRHFIEPGKGVLLMALYQDEMIAGTLFLKWKDTLYYKFNASRPAALALRPSDLLIWEGIQYGKSNGYSSLDFGLSDWDQDGLVHFKRKFATEEKTISFLKYPAQDNLHPQEEQTRKLLHQFTGLLTDETVPDHITEKAGELIYRFFV